VGEALRALAFFLGVLALLLLSVAIPAAIFFTLNM
jgi:cbb3-type cytochrome oxidase subunit 3